MPASVPAACCWWRRRRAWVTWKPAVAPVVPWQVIHGRNDQLIALDVLQRWLQSVDPAAPLQVIDDADHFFHGRLTPLREAAQAFWEPLWRTVP